jgi:rhodanese-related sulfurtransferase
MQKPAAALAAAVVATLLVAGPAGAQMKPKPQPPAGAQNPVQIRGAQVAPTPSLDSVKRITREEAQQLVKQGKAVYIDVRSTMSYTSGHIKGALSLPLSQLIDRLKEAPPNKMLITYCACVEEHTAAVAVVRLNQHGLKNAAALIGGWNDWKAKGLPTETGR